MVPGSYVRGTDSPMCAKFGKPLGRPGLGDAQEKHLQQHIANTCGSYGEPKPAIPGRNHSVMLPIPELRMQENIDPSRMAISSCSQCKNYVQEAVVAREIGYTAGICRAKGTLLLGNRLSYEARDCPYRQFGESPATTVDMQFLPEYNDTFTSNKVVNTSPTAQYFVSKSNFVDPTEYPTDKEVSEKDAQSGVRAWRKVVDPEGYGEDLFLPIYNDAHFSDEERALIPRTGDDEHPELYVDHFGGVYETAVAWLGLDETPALWGISGIGKTELYRHIAWLMALPFRRVSITADSQIEEVAGTKEFSPDKGTYFAEGEVPKAWTKAGVLVIDEPNVAKDPAVWHFLRPLTDNSKQLVLPMDGNRRLARHDDCYMGLAMNPAWDIRNVGALEIGDADANRLYHIWVDMPPRELEVEIIQERVKLDGWELSPEQIDQLMKTAESIRSLTASLDSNSELPITWAMRPQIKVARALRYRSPIMAYRRAAGDFLAPEHQQILLDQVRANWKDVN
jgi:MoxR-like ATPase